MRYNERKGAWVLLIAVLVFGALVWGIGGRKFREEEAAKQERQAQEQALQEQPQVISAEELTLDSEADSVLSAMRKERRERVRSRRSAAVGNADAADNAPHRDILGDTIARKK